MTGGVQKPVGCGALVGHDVYPRTVAFSPNGAMLASGTNDGKIYLWQVVNPAESQLLQIIEGHDREIDCLSFSADGSMLVSAGDDQSVTVWNVESGAKLYNLPAHVHNYAVACHPTEPWFAYVNPDAYIVIANLTQAASNQVLQRLSTDTNSSLSLAFSPDGTQIASGSIDRTVRVWDIASGKETHHLLAHRNYVESIAYSTDGQTIASASKDGTARLWELATGECVQILRLPRPYEGVNITGATGITDAQRDALRALGAMEDDSN